MRALFDQKIWPFLKLVRWPNLLVIILTQTLLRHTIYSRIYGHSGLEPAMSSGLFVALVCITVLIAAAGYIINDYFDQKADLVNHPGRVVLGSEIQKEVAIRYYYIFNAIALAAGVVLSWMAGAIKLSLIFFMIAGMLWLYSAHYKKTVLWGNLAVAFMSAMVVMVVWIFEFYMLKRQPGQFHALYLSGQQAINHYVSAYAVFAFLVSLVREIVKDMEDVDGDREAGYRTLPLAHGLYTAKVIAFIPGLAMVALAFPAILYFISLSFPVMALYFAVLVLFPLLFILYRIILSEEKQQFHRISTWLKLLMLAGIAGMVPLAATI